MAYIRAKTVKGIQYGYLVESHWDPKKKTSKQVTLKYLGKLEEITQDKLPVEIRNDPKILAFLASHSSVNIKEREKIIKKLRRETFDNLIEGQLNFLLETFDTYANSFGMIEFYEEILKPCMYEIGELWEKEQLPVAAEHIASNVAHSFVKILNEKMAIIAKKTRILICTPEGEWHNLGCNIVESFLNSKGYKVSNLSPSAPHDSILDHIREIKPDFIFISTTLRENIASCQRLIKKIKTKFKMPILVGGQAFNSTNSKIDAIIIENNSLNEIVKYLRTKAQ